ncbi:hypothetical protein [Vibrio sp. S12_S33]|uniref:hypothetical protein n=1 Tax=Vibrio sp. S12_S33 TaxID=2720223 RepID=UPI00178189E5|nr:hypothetical protein [Vibrio sp. S12_S33]MBD1567601.1 hypothetical protein [Vibrio sp. S12_S33]
MQVWVLPITLFSAIACSEPNIMPIEYEVSENIVFEEQSSTCESIVCKNMVEKQLVPKVGDVPKREGNKTIETIGSIIYFFNKGSQTDKPLPIDEMITVLSD